MARKPAKAEIAVAKPAGAAVPPAGTPCLRVTGPACGRRRAGFDFGPQGTDLTWEALGADDDARKRTIGTLTADPEIQVDFYDRDDHAGDRPGG